MKTYVNCTRFTPARGKVAAILIAACLAALSAESAAQPTADPSLAKAWIQEDSQGNRWVYYRLKSGEFSAGEQLTSTGADDHAPERNEELLIRPQPAADASGLNCIWTGFCWICP